MACLCDKDTFCILKVRFLLFLKGLSLPVLQVYTSHGPTVIMPTWFCSRSWFLKVGPFDEGGKVRVHTQQRSNISFHFIIKWINKRVKSSITAKTEQM